MSQFDIEPEMFLAEREAAGADRTYVLDVREQAEWDYYHLELATLMPMNQIPNRLDELPEDRTIYVVCAHGVRSTMVCNYLISRGRMNVLNVAGGMSAVAELLGFPYD